MIPDHVACDALDTLRGAHHLVHVREPVGRQLQLLWLLLCLGHRGADRGVARGGLRVGGWRVAKRALVTATGLAARPLVGVACASTAAWLLGWLQLCGSLVTAVTEECTLG